MTMLPAETAEAAPTRTLCSKVSGRSASSSLLSSTSKLGMDMNISLGTKFRKILLTLLGTSAPLSPLKWTLRVTTAIAEANDTRQMDTP